MDACDKREDGEAQGGAPRWSCLGARGKANQWPGLRTDGCGKRKVDEAQRAASALPSGR